MTTPASRLSCPACGCTVFTLFRRCRLCGWFVGWGSQNANAKPSVDAVEGHGVHEHVYRCQDCGLVESDVLSDERLAANADSEQSS